MYCLLIRHEHDRRVIACNVLLYDTRAQLDRAYDGFRRSYFAPVTFTKLQEITEDSHD